jgi:hypothetical protein
MSVREGLPLADATARQQHLDQTRRDNSLVEDEHVVRRVIAQYETGENTPATRALSEWIALHTARLS